MPLSPLRLGAEHLLWAAPPDFRFDCGDAAEAKRNSCSVPWLTNAIALDRTRAECIGHEWGREDYDLDVAVGIDAARCKPVAQLVVMPRMGMDHREADWASALARSCREGGLQRVTGHEGIEIGSRTMRLHLGPQRVRHRDGVAAKAERHRRDCSRSERRQSEIAGNRHRRQHVRDLEMPDGEPVANIGPGGFAHERKIHALLLGEALLLGRDDERAVEQWHESRGNLVLGHRSSPGPSKPAAITRLCAISAILRF